MFFVTLIGREFHWQHDSSTRFDDIIYTLLLRYYNIIILMLLLLLFDNTYKHELIVVAGCSMDVVAVPSYVCKTFFFVCFICSVCITGDSIT